MVIKSEKKSKKKFGKKKFEIKPKVDPNHREKSYFFVRKKVAGHYRQLGANSWLPIPSHKYRAFLADIDACAKLRAQGKQHDPFMFEKYYREPGRVCWPKPMANWKEYVREFQEEAAAKRRAKLMKKAYINEKEMCLMDAKAESLKRERKRKKKKAYQKKKQMCLIDAKADSLKEKEICL